MKVQIKSTLYEKRAHKRVRPETKDKKKHQRYKILYGVQCYNFKGKVLDRKKCPKKISFKTMVLQKRWGPESRDITI